MSFKNVLDSVTQMVNELVSDRKVQCKRCKEEKSDTVIVQTVNNGTCSMCAQCVDEVYGTSKR